MGLLVWPHEVEPWFRSWYRGRVETLDAKYNLAHSWYRGKVETLNAISYLGSSVSVAT